MLLPFLRRLSLLPPETSGSRATLSVREVTAFALGNLGIIPVMTIVNAYLLKFYTEFCGMEASAVATMFLLARVADGLNDPLIGFAYDHLPRTKWGRFRGYFLGSACLCALNLLALWFLPYLATDAKLLFAYVSYFFIGITFPMADIPLNSLLPAMTDDSAQRQVLSSVKGVFYGFGGMLVTMAVPLFLSFYPERHAAVYLGAVVCIVVVQVLFSALCALGVRERVYPVRTERYTARELRRLLFCRPVLSLFAAMLCSSASTALWNTTNIYFGEYVLGSPAVLTVFLLVSAVGVLPGVLFAGKLAEKFGKHRVYALAMAAMGVSFLLRLLAPVNLVLYYLTAPLEGFGLALVKVLTYGILADCTEYIEWKTGARAEGVLSALSSLTIKLGNAFGGSAPGFVFARTGERSVATVHHLNATAPGVLSLLASAVFFVFYPLRAADIENANAALQKQRGE